MWLRFAMTDNTCQMSADLDCARQKRKVQGNTAHTQKTSSCVVQLVLGQLNNQFSAKITLRTVYDRDVLGLFLETKHFGVF